MERAAVRDWGSAARAMIVPGALLTTARTADKYVDAAIEVLKPPSAHPGPDQR